MPPHPAPVERISRAWTAHAAGAREQVLVALAFAAAVGGAHLARLGTTAARAAAAGGLVLVLVAYIVLVVVRRREATIPRVLLRRVLGATDPAASERALRALTLVERTERDASLGSHELASLHFTRLLDRVSNDAVKSAARTHAQRLRAATLAILSGVVVVVLVGPSRIAEGANVLFAQSGRAPLPMPWVSFARLVAQPPSYTRETEKALVFGTSASLPKGTLITMRGVPREPDRALVLTDGTEEVPFTSDGAGGFVARWTLRRASVLRVAAIFGSVRIDDEESIELAVVPDLPPKVELEDAPRTVKLADLQKLDLRWSARDDYGLREVDLVMRSGSREERRVLGRFDGETRVERGGHVLLARDGFFRRVFLPIVITVEAKDNDAVDAPKWAASPSITVIPPTVGQPEAERHAGLRALRDDIVDLLKWRAEHPGERGDEMKTRVAAARERAESALAKTYSGATVPRGFQTFLRGQLDRLAERGAETEEGVESTALAVDVGLAALGNRDAVEVSKRLGDVAEEAAVTARSGRDGDRRAEALSRLDVILDIVERGAENLVTLGALGRDVGSVARGDAARVRRARQATDLLHAELAALHLAERLRKPSPSFGAKTGRGSGGVESGRSGRSGESDAEDPSPSSADSDFDRSASSVDDLAQEHQSTLQAVESALSEARKATPTDAERSDAKERADALRSAVQDLPLPGQDFGTPRASAALAREHAMAAARDLDDVDFERAVENAEKALSTLDEADRLLLADDPVRSSFAEARRALREARDFARARLDAQRAAAEARARSSLSQASDTEHALGERAEELSRVPAQGEGALPREIADQLGRAASVMREAARELGEGHGDKALALQREAQRLLEQSKAGRSTDRESEEGERAERPPGTEEGSRRDGEVALGGNVPPPDEAARAEEFRRRVLDGLARERRERLSPAVRRYAEGLLQ